jgi:hypothetical protein
VLYILLNIVQSKKKIEFLERMAAMMFAQLAFYQQGSTYLRDMEPYLRDLTNRIHSVSATLPVCSAVSTSFPCALYLSLL